ncbi:unnamed protein product [Pleuronectes platessa]|uniref:Uncharacterized protein n=1 Tax=Pleuronectes platessa TaxID=8262 RepID=A0A9N7YRI4_PLEPL|nr:unnamed protein product [Pleuronectes platessa]
MEGVRVYKGIRRRRLRVDGGYSRAADSICVEAGGRGLTCFVLRGQKMCCHSVVDLAQPPSNHAGDMELGLADRSAGAMAFNRRTALAKGYRLLLLQLFTAFTTSQNDLELQ